jgi:hypothetical protein
MDDRIEVELAVNRTSIDLRRTPIHSLGIEGNHGSLERAEKLERFFKHFDNTLKTTVFTDTRFLQGLRMFAELEDRWHTQIAWKPEFMQRTLHGRLKSLLVLQPMLQPILLPMLLRVVIGEKSRREPRNLCALGCTRRRRLRCPALVCVVVRLTMHRVQSVGCDHGKTAPR